MLSVLLIISLLLEFVVVYMTFLLGRDQEWYITFFFKNLWQILIPATLVEILPYLIFLTVSQLFLPHDCFRCFGKDPERKFSVYQFTKEELKIIERNKRGKGALKQDANEALDNFIRVQVHKLLERGTID
jgi:hypothetical protein